MAKVNFTAGRVANFECDSGKSQSFLWDTSAPGLGLRVTANGAKAFMFQAKLNGQAMRIIICSPSIWTIEAAKIESRRLKVIIDNGQDPRQVKTDGLVAAQAIRDAQEAKKTAAATLTAKTQLLLNRYGIFTCKNESLIGASVIIWTTLKRLLLVPCLR